MKINSDDDNIGTVRKSERVEISICKLEREYEENYFVDIGQMVDFPQVYFKPRSLQKFLKGKSPLEETNVFSSSPLIFSRCFYDLALSVWTDRKSMKWCYGKRYFDRKTETFKAVSYTHLDVYKRQIYE